MSLHLNLTMPAQPLLPKHGKASSENRHCETGVRRVPDANVALVQQGWGIDMFSKGGGFGVLDKEPEEPCGHSAEILFNFLLDVDDER